MVVHHRAAGAGGRARGLARRAAAVRVRAAAGALRGQDGDVHPARGVPDAPARHGRAGTARWAYPCGWALAWWGLVLYWVAAIFYLVQTAGVVREARAMDRPARRHGAYARADFLLELFAQPARPRVRRRRRPPGRPTGRAALGQAGRVRAERCIACWPSASFSPSPTGRRSPPSRTEPRPRRPGRRGQGGPGPYRRPAGAGPTSCAARSTTAQQEALGASAAELARLREQEAATGLAAGHRRRDVVRLADAPAPIDPITGQAEAAT